MTASAAARRIRVVSEAEASGDAVPSAKVKKEEDASEETGADDTEDTETEVCCCHLCLSFLSFFFVLLPLTH